MGMTGNPSYDLLGLAYGLIIGISLGLTGGGGSIFAVPTLIYGLGVPISTSIGLSLAAVGLTAGFGAALRLHAKWVFRRRKLLIPSSRNYFFGLGIGFNWSEPN